MSEEIRKILKNHEKRVSALEKILKKRPRRILRERKSTENLLIELKSEEFFREGRTISQIRDALHAKGRIVKLTDLPPYLLKLIRDDVLKRKRKMIGKRKIWAYLA